MVGKHYFITKYFCKDKRGRAVGKPKVSQPYWVTSITHKAKAITIIKIPI